MAPKTDLAYLDTALKRLDVLCRAAARMGSEASRAQRIAMIVDLEAGLRLMRIARADMRARLSRSRQSRSVATAYGRAQSLRLSPR
jgi:hypothetical protein